MQATDHTIIAVSTAAGGSARAIVRLSGPRAVELAAAAFARGDGRPVAALGPFRCADGLIVVDAMELPARVYVFRAPRSYTRQDVVELHLPGSPPAVTAVLGKLIDLGARQAQPGEFTARALFAGRIDLSEAEAVADVIHADDDAQLRAAMRALGGRLHRLCSAAAGQCAEALATVEASIDLADEDIDLQSPASLAEQLQATATDLRHTAAGAADVPDTARHVHVVLAGRPNAGKSSLVNALTGANRAIVSAMAGTTRDVLSAPLALGEATVILQDAAGFAPPADGLAAAADSAARQAVAQADVVGFVIDLAAGDHTDDLALLAEARRATTAPMLVLANKADLTADAAEAAQRLAERVGASTIAVSAETGHGLATFIEQLGRHVRGSAGRSGGAMGLHIRQKQCLLAAATAADQAAEKLASCGHIVDVAELVAIDLRGSLAQLGQISGEVVTEDVLGRIFARFCVGK